MCALSPRIIDTSSRCNLRLSLLLESLKYQASNAQAELTRLPKDSLLVEHALRWNGQIKAVDKLDMQMIYRSIPKTPCS